MFKFMGTQLMLGYELKLFYCDDEGRIMTLARAVNVLFLHYQCELLVYSIAFTLKLTGFTKLRQSSVPVPVQAYQADASEHVRCYV